MTIISQLKSFAAMTNIADETSFDDKELLTIGHNVLIGYEEDLRSMGDWLADVKKVEDLAALSVKKKTYPLPNSANIKYPLIAQACYQFSSRTYPELFKDGKVVKSHILGNDTILADKQDQADRVEDYMNYQLLFDNSDWELEQDRLLFLLALIGFICKKTYYDPIRKKNVSEMCDYKDVIINSEVKNLNDAPRVSHVIHVRLNNLIEAVNAKVFCKDPVNELINEMEAEILNPVIDLIEQHTYLDLDKDNYSEPYIVTILKKTGKVLRIAPRFHKDDVEGSGDEIKYINPVQCFTDYHFLVSPKGKFQSVGFGILMLHLNETINSVLNQLLDSGQLANMQGGYKDARLKNLRSGDQVMNPGEWVTLKATAGATIKEGIIPINYKEPSSVLYQLLELLIQAGKELSSSGEMMTGNSSAENAKTGATQALIGEGQKIHAAIQKRTYGSLGSELKKLFRLNSIYLDPKIQYNIVDAQKIVHRTDFDNTTVNIIPIADPNLSSETQRSQRNQVLLAVMQLPGVNQSEVVQLILQNANLGVPVADLLTPAGQQKPDPAMLELQAKIQNMSEQNQLKGHELQIKEKELQIEATKALMQCLELKARAGLEEAQAQATGAGIGFKEQQMQLDIISKGIEAMENAAGFGQQATQNAHQMNQDQQATDQNQQKVDQEGEANAGQDSSVEGPSDNQGSDQGSAGA